jgi:hypothetical protein
MSCKVFVGHMNNYTTFRICTPLVVRQHISLHNLTQSSLTHANPACDCLYSVLTSALSNAAHRFGFGPSMEPIPSHSLHVHSMFTHSPIERH